MNAMTGPRDLRDAKRLAELEAAIDRGMQSFVEVGEALLEVRDSKLYRINYPTFEAYCKGRWKIGDRRARQLMEATEAIKALPTGTMVPVSERQARELAPVIESHGPEVAAAVMAEASKDGPATAQTIRAAAAPFRPRLDPEPYAYGESDPLQAAAAALADAPEVRQAEQDYRAAVLIRDLTRARNAADPTEWAERLIPEDVEAFLSQCLAFERWISEWRKALARPLRVVGGKS